MTTGNQLQGNATTTAGIVENGAVNVGTCFICFGLAKKGPPHFSFWLAPRPIPRGKVDYPIFPGETIEATPRLGENIKVRLDKTPVPPSTLGRLTATVNGRDIPLNYS